MTALLMLAPPAAADTLEEGAAHVSVAQGLDKPVDLAFGPDGALYYAELTGSLRRIAPGASTPDPEPVWTPPNLVTGGERGLVGLALDPDFSQNRAFYVFYVTDKGGHIVNRVSKIVDGAETVLLDDLFSETMHNSGRIAFLPDKTMLVSAGDAIKDTAGPQASMHAHDETNMSGKVLRINRDGSVPADNPWGNAVWTKGHRNVYGIAVSPSGVVIGTENGPEKGDEVNLLRPGNDYGWPTCKGSECTADSSGFTMPLLEYDPTIAPTGAAWYRGHFYFSDFNKGRVHRIYETANGTWADERVLRLDQPRILDLEAGPDGLYFATWSEVYRLTVDEKWHDATPPVVTPTPDDERPTDETPTNGTPTPQSPTPTESVEQGGSTIPAPAAPAALALLAITALLRRTRK